MHLAVLTAPAHAPLLTDQNTSQLFTPCGSSATTVTVTGSPGCGTTRVWPKWLKVGPAFATNREFCAPGVPFNAGIGSTAVRAARLK